MILLIVVVQCINSNRKYNDTINSKCSDTINRNSKMLLPDQKYKICGHHLVGIAGHE